MTVARLLIAAPIPSIDSWIVAAELPPGYMVLLSLTIARRETLPTTSSGREIPGKNLVPREDINALPSQHERLLQAYARCDAAGRAEVLKIAEVLAGAA